jgi:tetratricopeptide (TPR) repeat protein
VRDLTTLLELCVVRISGAGVIGGTGFWVAPGRVLTCAHVLHGLSGARVEIRWQGRELTGSVVDRRPGDPAGEGPYPLPDLAQVMVEDAGDHPCVMLDADLPAVDARLHARGFTTAWSGRPDPEPIGMVNEGAHPVTGGVLLKLAADGPIRAGMSGAPVLDIAEGRVRGVLRSHDEPDSTVGWAVPGAAVWEAWPDLEAAHRAFHLRDERWRRAAEAWDELSGELFERRLVPRAGESPSFLLHPDYAVVPFRGREGLLRELEAWAELPGAFAVRLLTGPGGQGKTRLARELCRRLEETGWLAGLVRRDLGRRALKRARRASCPELLVVDYTEARPHQALRLVEALQGRDPAHPVRVLLLARGAGDWWTQLRSSSALAERALEGAQETELYPLETTAEGRQAAYTDALVHFAVALGVDPSRVPPDAPAPESEGPEPILQLHMLALAAVLAARDGGQEGPPASALLGHERRYWEGAARARGISLSPWALGRAVAAAVICGAEGEDQAVRVLRRVPELAQLDADTLHGLAQWLHEIYPGPEYWNSLQPDRVAEDLVALVEEASPELPGLLLADAADAQLQRGLVIHARAAARHPHVAEALLRLLGRGPRRVVAAAVRAVSRLAHPAPLVQALKRFVEAVPDPGLVLALERIMPTHSEALADLAVDVTRRALHLLRVDRTASPAEVARVEHSLALRLAWAGDRGGALEAIEEAVRLRREMLGQDRERFLPEYADSLLVLSAQRAEWGLRYGALAPARQAVRLYRHLARQEPEGYTAELADALINLSVRLARAQRWDVALSTAEEAVGIYQELAERDTAVFFPRLARAVRTLAMRLTKVRPRRHEALPIMEHALEMYRRLAEANPDAYLPDLATVLSDLSSRLADRNEPERALNAINEAVGLSRRLATANRDAYVPFLARALTSQAARLERLHLIEAARRPIEEGVGIWRGLERRFPGMYESELGYAEEVGRRLGADV